MSQLCGNNMFALAQPAMFALAQPAMFALDRPAMYALTQPAMCLARSDVLREVWAAVCALGPPEDQDTSLAAQLMRLRCACTAQPGMTHSSGSRISSHFPMSPVAPSDH